MSTQTTCWKITRKDNQILGFTEHDVNLLVDGVDYLSAVGYTPSAIEHGIDGSVDNMEISGIVHFSGIDEEDIRAGLYDYAKVECILVDWNTQTKIQTLVSGWLGEIKISDEQFNAELRGLTQKLQTPIGEQYLPHCPAIYGDERCTKVPDEATFVVTVSGSNRIFTASGLTQADDYFKYGKVIWTLGDNDTFEMDVKEFSAGVVELYEPMPFDIAIGDEGIIYEGCEKSIDACFVKDNVINFRGFPHIPGIGEMVRDKISIEPNRQCDGLIAGLLCDGEQQ